MIRFEEIAAQRPDTEGLAAEYREVAGRKKFAKQRACLEGVIAGLLGVALFVDAGAECDVCLDADDNLLLDCARCNRTLAFSYGVVYSSTVI